MRIKASLVQRLLGFVVGLGLVYLLAMPHSFARETISQTPQFLDQRPQRLNQGVQLYQSDQIRAAAEVFEQLIQADSFDVPRSLALNYLSLIYQKQGQWSQATAMVQAAIATLQSPPLNTDPTTTLALAQALNTQGQLQLNLGQAEAALATWKQATAAYRQAGDVPGVLLSLTNQAQALQAQGFYQQALVRLAEVTQTLQNQPDSLLKATSLRSLGNALQMVGDSVQARKKLRQSLTIAESLQDAQAIADAWVSLGNLNRTERDWLTALTAYQQAAVIAPSALTRLQAWLNQLDPLVETNQAQAAQALLPAIQGQLAALPPSRASIDGRVYLLNSLIQLHQVKLESPSNLPSWLEMAQIGATAIQQAQTLGDVRAQASATGALGRVYEQTQQLAIAQDLTQQALLLAQAAQAPDIVYRWQWQAGRLWQKMGQSRGGDQRIDRQAIAAYQGAVDTLKTLRRDLVAFNPDVQFSFRDSVEPVYREFVNLLLKPAAAELDPKNLLQARNAIESLQLAELENFFRQACLDAKPIQIDRVDATAAVIYPIILGDRLEVIASLPGQALQHYATPLPQAALEAVIENLLVALLDQKSQASLPLFQQVYDWLIRPIATDLKQSQVKTLVFVLDGAMRSVPMAALHDGQQYLIEQYGIALTPGLQLLDVKPLQRERLNVLTAGLTQARQGYDALPSVASEIQQIQLEVPSRILLNEAFTNAALKTEIQSFSGPIVHLATHGEFSSRVAGTFLLTWDGRIDINELNQLLQARRPQRQAIELLVLSACRTALGDNQAALGLAGMAVRAGARSTIGTLWYVDDEATASIMARFYREFTNSAVSKAEALRRAQLTLLKDPTYSHPYFWAAYILIGNWL